MGRRRSTIAATGAAIAGDNFPGAILTNEDLERMLGDDPKTGTSAEWIKEVTGIEERRIAFGDTQEISVASAKNLYETSGIDPSETELVIVARNTPPVEYPSVAHGVAGYFDQTCGAFDVQCGCSGFGYALPIAASLIERGIVNNAIVISSDVLSGVTDFRDRGTCVLLADGSGSAFLRATDKPGIIDTYFESQPDTKGWLTEEYKKGTSLDYITNPLGGHFELGEEIEKNYLVMKGRHIYNFAVGTKKNPGGIERCIRGVIDKSGYKLEDVDIIIPHQANLRMISAVADLMGVDPDKFYMTIQKYGNSSTASYIIALHEAVKEGRVKEGDLVLMPAFGAGLSTAATLMRWDTNPTYSL